MLKRYISFFLLIILICFFNTACTDATEIDNSIYAVVIGLDKGVTNKLRVTIQYPTYAEAGGGGSAMGSQSKGPGDKAQSYRLEGSNVHTMEASSILEAINLFNTAITRSVSLSHVKMLIISEDFARDGIEEYLAPIARSRETRPTIQVVVTKDKADDFIRQNKTNIGPSASKAAELMIAQSDVTGYFPKISFNNLYESILSPYNEGIASYAGINNFTNISDATKEGKTPVRADIGILPGDTPRIGVTKREFIGTAVFSGAKMVGVLNSVETRLMLMIQNKFQKGIITFEDKHKPDCVIPCDMKLGRSTKITARFENNRPVIDVNLNLEADVGAIQSRLPYEDISMIGELNNIIKENIENGANKLIEKTQKEFKSDIFGFGFYIAKKYSTIQKFMEYDWLTHYPDAKVNVNVVVNVRRTGLMIKSAPIITSKFSGGGQ